MRNEIYGKANIRLSDFRIHIDQVESQAYALQGHVRHTHTW
jgi:hypothetical protein